MSAQGWSRAVEHYIEQIPASSELSKKARNSLFEEMSQAKNFSAFQTALKQYYQVLKGDKTGRFDPEKARFKSLLDLFESASYLQRSTIKRVEGLTAEKLRAKESEIKEKIQAMVTTDTPKIPSELDEFDEVVNNKKPRQSSFDESSSSTSTDGASDDTIHESNLSISSFQALKKRHEGVKQYLIPLYFNALVDDPPKRYFVFDKVHKTMTYHNNDEVITAILKHFPVCRDKINRLIEAQGLLEKKEPSKVVSVHLESEVLEELLDLGEVKSELLVDGIGPDSLSQ